LYFKKTSEKNIIVFIDANWTGSVTDRKSTIGYIIMYGGVWLLGEARNKELLLGLVRKLNSCWCIEIYYAQFANRYNVKKLKKSERREKIFY